MAGETRLTSGWAYSIISKAVCVRAGCGWASVAQWQSISLVMRRLWVRFPPLAPEQKVIRKDDLLFWVPAAKGRLHPSEIKMHGANELPLRRGFACGKTLVRRKCAAGQKAGCSGCMQSFRNFKISILTTLPSSSQATYRLRRAFSFYCKAHRALILLLLASKPNPLRWASIWFWAQT